ncbi:helix-turn-helix domain-containing protein [Streptomyces sp. 8P21H-1]|uniref:AlbA family DNA-binding domain-containing protein n=1 Tax=Streptomyces sp. 8P21H-1 TaxID=2737048 RepID=UPI00156EA1D7|nr:ATP-binding protein [Streptomyces sp. 8P21H-1]NSL43656.1 ATP-binding protein [Streptomyces sp. 8P21H-1]
MALPARLTAALGRHPDDLTEDDLQRAVDNHIPESVDLDWKKDFYKGTDADKKELAKDVSAMANTAGGMVVVGVDDGKQDHAHALAPFEPVPGRGEEWIRAVLANWIQPVVPNVGVRPVKSTVHEGKIYWVLTVPPSTQAPHAVAAPGNDYNFRVHVRHGTTTRTLAESEIAQRYRDRFQAASDDVDRLHQVAGAGFGYLSAYLTSTAHGGSPRATYFPAWVSLAAVPAVRGTHSLTTQADRDAAFDRFFNLATEGVTTRVQPDRPVLVGRRQVRFEGDPTGQLHQDGAFYVALPLNFRSDQFESDGPKRLFQRGIELDLVALVQAAAAWATETGAAGDVMLSAALHRFDGSDDPVRLVVSESAFQHGPAMPLPATPAQTTGDLAAIVIDKREAVVVACALVSDLLADMGAHQPYVLTPEGDILTDRLNDGFRHQLTGWGV